MCGTSCCRHAGCECACAVAAGELTPGLSWKLPRALAGRRRNLPLVHDEGRPGWIAPEEYLEGCIELFKQTDVRHGMGVHPRLIHTRFGFHIIEVLGQRRGSEFGQVRERIQASWCSNRGHRLQYMQLLVGQARGEGPGAGRLQHTPGTMTMPANLPDELLLRRRAARTLSAAPAAVSRLGGPGPSTPRRCSLAARTRGWCPTC